MVTIYHTLQRHSPLRILDMDTDEESTVTENNADDDDSHSSSSSRSAQPCAFSCDKLRDDLLSLFSTGTFYDCTFKVSDDKTNESKVNFIFFSTYFTIHKIINLDAWD